MNNELNFNVYYNEDGENLEKLVIEALLNFLNETQKIGWLNDKNTL